MRSGRIATGAAGVPAGVEQKATPLKRRGVYQGPSQGWPANLRFGMEGGKWPCLSCSMDRRAQRPCLLRLFHQLPDRARPCRHRRCRTKRAIRQAKVGATRTKIECTEARFGFAFGDQTEPEPNSSSRPPPKTFARRPGSFQRRSERLPPEADEGGRRAPAPISASTSSAFSTLSGAFSSDPFIADGGPSICFTILMGHSGATHTKK